MIYKCLSVDHWLYWLFCYVEYPIYSVKFMLGAKSTQAPSFLVTGTLSLRHVTLRGEVLVRGRLELVDCQLEGSLKVRT